MENIRIALVTTAYNESACIEAFVKEAYSRMSNLLNYSEIVGSFEICIANNCSNDNTLQLLLDQKKSLPMLRVIDNSMNYGYDVSILNALKSAKADIFLVMCSDFEDPFADAFDMLKEFVDSLGYDNTSVLGVKRLKLPWIFRFNRYVYYLISGFGSRTSSLPGFHGFGVYSKQSIDRALDYAEKVAPNARKSLLWGSVNYRPHEYIKNQRRGGKSSYTLLSYYKEALSQIFDLPSLSSRLAIRFSFLFIVFSLLSASFFIFNWFANFMIFPNGTTTIIMLLLISTFFNLLILFLLSRQLENLVMPNSLSLLISREL